VTVLTIGATFPKILVPVRESRRPVDKAVCYAMRIAKDYIASKIIADAIENYVLPIRL
jgi:hypothetical protein